MYIPPEYTGKNCHTYFDYECDGEIVDYLGKNGKYHEFSGVNISPVDFTLSLTSQFIDTTIFTLIAFTGTVSFKELVSLIFTTYILKAIVAVLDTPVLYIAKKIKNNYY